MPASCVLRTALSLFDSASLYLESTLSKSAVLSALIRMVTTAASPSSVITGAGFAASCAEATAAPASVKPASAIPETKTCKPRNITASCERFATLPYCPADENRHYVVSQKHAMAREGQSPPGLMEQPSSAHIRR